MSTTKTIQLLLLSGVAATALSVPASALEAQAFVDRVAEVYRTMGYELSFGEATLEGDTITVDGVTVEVVGAGEEPMEVETTLTFRGVSETEDGAYWAEELTIPDVDTVFTTEEDEVEGRVTLSDIRIEGLYFPSDDSSALAQVQGFEAASAGPLSVFRNGEEVVRVESMEARSTFNPEQGTGELTDVESTLAINGIWADLSTMSEDDPESGAVIEQLGLNEINGNVTQHMTWSMADGHMVMDEFLIDFDDLGALDITFDITGFTPEVLDQIYAMQAQMADGGEMTEEQAQAQMMSGMALMQGVNIVSAAIRYEDASLVGSLLDFFAEDAGTDRATFVEGLKQQLPAMLQGTGIPALNDLIVPPVSAFLDDPQSIEIAARPASPTSLLVLMAAAANPAGLIPALGLTVTANQ